MFIQLDFESKKPIYTQLKHEIIAGIARKDLSAGEALPSVRSLAADLGINLHTVNKAYQQLKQEGFILIHRQKGVVIHPDGVPEAGEDYYAELKETLRPSIAESICRGLSEEEYLSICQDIFKGFKEGEKK
ncbi:GntR family transcriptional regulator [Halobacillus litoralis]|uniref:GntR family transcriptional regulator n=1 Tax=Halobacillus litoralis TaxID=45668 RepID=UPI001CD59D32|nr:GntR family transcriptional regulator [Halobacillus litoralis]MCA0971219.1 GntR family transcriptional regulator [Halobacillus litoralis]